ncbi:hypothetical protein [Escherichia coli]|uniref:hypothetical protein n=1 Tax=Escherichia coli TaxID=562 RepID=UPI00384F87B6
MTLYDILYYSFFFTVQGPPESKQGGTSATLEVDKRQGNVGFAMSIIDEDEAKATLDALRQMDYDITSA